MPAKRFFIATDLKTETYLEGSEFHHLVHVMRAQVGDIVELVNGKGSLAKAKLISLTQKKAVFKILELFQKPPSDTYRILAAPLMRLSKLELVIEKCTELGVDAFWLYAASHSEKKELSAHQQQRLQAIAIQAMKQCGRLTLPLIKIKTFSEIFKENRPYYFGDPRKETTDLSFPKKLIFTVGPEKGFSKDEYLLLEKRATGISLHQNTLRAETACIAFACLAK